MPGFMNGYCFPPNSACKASMSSTKHKDDRAGCAVTMVRGKVQDDRPARDLHERRGVLTAFLPVKLAPEVIEAEALGCLDVVHPQDRNRRFKFDAHASDPITS